MMTEPTKDHAWLEQLIGEWKFESECAGEPGGEPMKSGGVEHVRSLGGLWVVCEGGGEMPGGGSMSFIMSVGFDPAKNKYVGSWIASCMGMMFVYEGDLDESTNTLTLNTTGPSFEDPTKTARYQDIIEIKSADERELRSRFQDDKGEWHNFMKATYRRVK